MYQQPLGLGGPGLDRPDPDGPDPDGPDPDPDPDPDLDLDLDLDDRPRRPTSTSSTDLDLADRMAGMRLGLLTRTMSRTMLVSHERSNHNDELVRNIPV